MNPTNLEYLDMLRTAICCGSDVSPRGFKCHEVIQHTAKFSMVHPVITLPKRDLDYQFMVAEAVWILSGESKLDVWVHKNLVKYSDDGIHMNGAYGPPFGNQRDYVVDALIKDRDTRQAVINFWMPNPFPSKDIPCTCIMQFLVRDGKLHTCVYMRSSDMWLGVPYDIFTFSMMSLSVLLKLKISGIDLELGELHWTAGSRHLYERNMEQAQEVFVDGDRGDNLTIDIHNLNTPDDLMIVLKSIRNIHSDKTLSVLRREICL